jgi:hypothetical protein
MRHLLATTAIATLAATPLVAQNMGSLFEHDMRVASDDIYAAGFIGQPIYATETEIEDGVRFTEDELTAVGEIDDLVMTRDGDVKGVVLGVGGVLEMGEKNVLVRFDDLNFVREDGEGDERFIVLETTAEEVENAPAFEYNDAMTWWTG